ncbi:MAG: B12-binding domain-containing radical SAM protein [Acidobacteriota bacterium]
MATTRRQQVVLIEPDINAVTRRFSFPSIASYPPLGPVRLAAQIDGGNVEIVDFRIKGEREKFFRRIRNDAPAVVGISLTFTSNGDEAISATQRIRQASPSTAIVLGGTAASEDPASFFDAPVDFICHRAGDLAFAALVQEIRTTGAVPDRFPGFFHREGDQWVLDPGPPALPLSDLRPFAWHLLPARYWRAYFQGCRPTGIGQSSEGCPYDCTFCSVWKTHGRRVNLASLANIQHDFLSLPRSVRGFFFADDIWMQASERQVQSLYDPLLEWMVADYLPRRGDFWLTVETRTDLYLRQEARFKAWISRAGLKRIFFGVEAVTDEQLKSYSKRNTVDQNSEAMRHATEAGAMVTAQFVIPCDADRAHFDETIRFIKAHRRWIRNANFTIATPLPGTDLYQEAQRRFPDLADRMTVAHSAFSLFTALTPTRLEVREFYEQVARLFREANQVQFSFGIVKQLSLMGLHSPWLIPRLARVPKALKALTDPLTYLDVHRKVQGNRLLGSMVASPDPIRRPQPQVEGSSLAR